MQSPRVIDKLEKDEQAACVESEARVRRDRELDLGIALIIALLALAAYLVLT